jgi:SAM-dependent methyltransferase
VQALIQQVRAWWNDGPCGSTHGRADEGSPQYFENIRRHRYFVESHIPDAAQFDRWAGKDVLEVGCGLGTDLLEFARAGARVSGVDLTPRSIRMARRRFDLEGRAADLRTADGRALPFADASFDLVWCFGVIHHSPEPERIVAEIRRVLRPAGRVVAMLYHRRSFRVAYDMLWRHGVLRGGLLRRSPSALVAHLSEARRDCPIVRLYSRREAVRLFGDFSDVSLEARYLHRFAEGPYRRGEFRPRPLYRALPGPAWRALERVAGWHLLIRGEKP